MRSRRSGERRGYPVDRREGRRVIILVLGCAKRTEAWMLRVRWAGGRILWRLRVGVEGRVLLEMERLWRLGTIWKREVGVLGLMDGFRGGRYDRIWIIES